MPATLTSLEKAITGTSFCRATGATARTSSASSGPRIRPLPSAIASLAARGARRAGRVVGGDPDPLAARVEQGEVGGVEDRLAERGIAPVSGTSTATRLRVSSAGRRGLTRGSSGRSTGSTGSCGAGRCERGTQPAMTHATSGPAASQRNSDRARLAGGSDSDAMTSVPMNGKLEPGLYIVATPIGNLSDLSPARRRRCSPRADLIAVEDSRVTAKLLRHIGVKRPMHALSRSQCRQGAARPDRADGERGGRPRLGRRHAAHLRSRLQAGPRRPRGRRSRSSPSPAPAR